ncbi:MAG: TIGR04053 family radical SAM/SPASM domain-containing protein [Caldisphaeraceae archaeon]|nr:TIGR04053 family radical SAM/SPASM domain-containing protein [Caldisphaeraceae archaeon]MEB3797666.1 TIGR04053 family radical SAM/SPASM domain-containing protein [Caldisphaeraceae archaeon]
MKRGSWPLSEKPILVFWETTKACLLSCKHCRAEAITKPLPNEMNTKEGMRLIDQVSEFGKPSPILIFTGGDPLMRNDIWELVDYAHNRGVVVALSPSVTPKLEESFEEFRKHKVSSVSISIDSPYEKVHDGIRGVEGTFKKSVEAIKRLKDMGIRVQVNTTVMRSTVDGLPDMVRLLKELKVDTWEVFYLVPTGRATFREDLSKEEWEDVSSFLYEASKYNITIRTSEGPIFRRVSLLYKALESKGVNVEKELPHGSLYYRLIKRLHETLGKPEGKSKAETHGTRDGMGVIFVSYDGLVYPSGFLPYPVGSIRKQTLVEIYRRSTILNKIRSSGFKGKCGECEFKYICGGSRSRAFSYTGDVMAEDPSCIYKPMDYDNLLKRYGLTYEDLLSSGDGHGEHR